MSFSTATGVSTNYSHKSRMPTMMQSKPKTANSNRPSHSGAVLSPESQPFCQKKCWLRNATAKLPIPTIIAIADSVGDLGEENSATTAVIELILFHGTAKLYSFAAVVVNRHFAN